MNIKDLGETHAGFYQDILESVTGKSRKRIGDIFLEYKERFLKYGDYCAMLPRAQETLDALVTRDEAVREEIARCETGANDGKFRLRDLLVVPMQRVLKYHLLLRELTDHTPPSHEEYRSIGQAYEAMLDVSDYINEVTRDAEQLHIIREIQNSITDWNMPPDVELKDYGRLRKDSELKVQSHDSGGKTKVRYVFVFDKVMLMCKSTRGDHYSYKDSLKLSEFRVEETAPPPPQPQSAATRTLNRIGGRGGDSRWAHPFLLVHVENTVAYTLFARTEEDKNKWVGAVKEALNNVLPPQRLTSTHEALMFTFEQPRSCDYCHRLLKGLFYQGYRCERCGRAMHKECIALLAKCGRSAPPALPPRPPSMLPTATLSNRISSCSLDDSSALQRQSSLASVVSIPPPSMPPPPTTNGAAMGGGGFLAAASANPDYINTKMEEHSWYVGKMDRDSANSRLAIYPTNTFLVRERVQRGQTEGLGHALSLKTQDGVKHMKICTGGNSEKDSGNVFYLSDTRKFRSVVELVSWFSRNSLKESFSGLDTTLQFSVGELFIAEAQFDWSPTEKNMLPLRQGDRLTVMDKMGDSRGWWKAFDGSRVGFIPKNYVEEVEGGEKRENGGGEDTLLARRKESTATIEEERERENNGEQERSNSIASTASEQEQQDGSGKEDVKKKEEEDKTNSDGGASTEVAESPP